MSLDWNVSKVADNVAWETATHTDRAAGIEAGKEYLAPIANALIWHTMNVDLGEITKANCGEFFRRVQLWELAFGAFLTRWTDDNKSEPLYITADDVRRHIGLFTNVANKTAKQFDAKLAKNQLREIQRKADRANRDRADALIAEVDADIASRKGNT